MQAASLCDAIRRLSVGFRASAASLDHENKFIDAQLCKLRFVLSGYYSSSAGLVFEKQSVSCCFSEPNRIIFGRIRRAGFFFFVQAFGRTHLLVYEVELQEDLGIWLGVACFKRIFPERCPAAS